MRFVFLKAVKAQKKDEVQAIREYGVLASKARLRGQKVVFAGIQRDEKRHLRLLKKL